MARTGARSCCLPLAGNAWPMLLGGGDAWRWAVVAVLVLVGVGLRSPWPPDEPRFALIAMDMVANGHWLLPHRGGEIYADKPPVFMWLQALFFLLTGNMRIAFLLPSMLGSLATLWMVHDLTRRLFGREQAWFAVLVLLVTVQFMAKAKSGQIDATLAAFTTLGLYGLLRYHCLGHGPRWLAVAWLAMGVGVITKGVGFLPAFALAGLLAARWRFGPRVSAGSGGWKPYVLPLLVFLPALLWLTPLFIAAHFNGQQEVAAYLDEILFRQTATRYAEGLGHFRPFWYYLVNVIPAMWLPLSVLLFWLAPEWRRQLGRQSLAHWMLLGFVLLALLFFSFSPGKRGVYMLPLLPAMAILAGGGLDALDGRRAPVATLRVLTLAVGLALLVAAAAGGFDLGSARDFLARSGVSARPAMLLLLSLGLVWTASAVLARAGGAFTAAMLSSWLLFCTWGYLLLDPARSSSELMASVGAELPPDGELAIVGFREQQLLQADRDVVHWGYHDDLKSQVVDAAAWLWSGPNRYLLAPEAATDPCVGKNRGQWMGYRHRRNWRLLTAMDLEPQLNCTPSAPASRYLAPWVGYPGGRNQARLR